MSRPRKWDKDTADRIKAAQDISDDGLEDLPPPSRLPEQPKISGTREEAIERGRLLGEDESYRRREIKEEATLRVKRAMAYAAWEFDGKPDGGDYKKEFGIGGSKLLESFDRPMQ